MTAPSRQDGVQQVSHSHGFFPGLGDFVARFRWLVLAVWIVFVGVSVLGARQVKGSLVSGGTHRLEAVFWLTGLSPRTMYARMAGPRPNFDYQTAITVDLANGAVATVLNEAQGPEWRVEITIFGETGAIFIRNREMFVLDQRGERLSLVSAPPDSDALTDFYAAVVEGRPLLTTSEDGYWAVAAVQAAYASAASGTPVKVRPFGAQTRP